MGIRWSGRVENKLLFKHVFSFPFVRAQNAGMISMSFLPSLFTFPQCSDASLFSTCWCRWDDKLRVAGQPMPLASWVPLSGSLRVSEPCSPPVCKWGCEKFTDTSTKCEPRCYYVSGCVWGAGDTVVGKAKSQPSSRLPSQACWLVQTTRVMDILNKTCRTTGALGGYQTKCGHQTVLLRRNI